MDFLFESPYQEILEGHPSADRLIPVEPHLSPLRLLKYAIWLRKEEYDAVFDLQSNGKTGLLTFATGAAETYGFATGSKFFYRTALPRRKTPTSHHVENQFQLLEAAGIKEPPGHLNFPPPLPFDFGIKKPYAVLHPVVQDPKRNLGTAKWRRIAKGIEKKGLTPVFVGTSAEKDFIKEIGIGEDLSGKLTLLQLRSLIAGASLFVGMDSGPMHLASTTSTPIVAIFGAGPSAWYRPWRREKVEIVEKNPPCKPCPLRKPCPYREPPCIAEISPEEVIAAAERLL